MLLDLSDLLQVSYYTLFIEWWSVTSSKNLILEFLNFFFIFRKSINVEKPIEYVKYWLRNDHLNKYMPYGNSVLQGCQLSRNLRESHAIHPILKLSPDHRNSHAEPRK